MLLDFPGVDEEGELALDALPEVLLPELPVLGVLDPEVALSPEAAAGFALSAGPAELDSPEPDSAEPDLGAAPPLLP